MTTHRPTPFLSAALALGFGLLLVGCSSSARTTADRPGLPERFPNHSAAEIQKRIAASADTLRSFSARARITIRTPDRNQSVNAVVRQRQADSLFMSFSKFGVEGGRLLLTPDSVFFFDTRKAVLRTGSVEAAQNIFPAPVASDQLFENMLGLLAPDPTTSWTIEADSTYYYLTSDTGRERYMVDPSRWRVVRYVTETPGGTVSERRLFSDFKAAEGVLVPHRLIFRRPEEDLSAVMTYRQIDFNPSSLPLSIDVPSQVPRKPLR